MSTTNKPYFHHQMNVAKNGNDVEVVQLLREVRATAQRYRLGIKQSPALSFSEAKACISEILLRNGSTYGYVRSWGLLGTHALFALNDYY